MGATGVGTPNSAGDKDGKLFAFTLVLFVAGVASSDNGLGRSLFACVIVRK